jgi:hypothetical protein
MDSEDERVAAVTYNSVLDRGLGKPGLVKEEKDDLETRIANMTREERLARMRELLEPIREYLHEFEAEAEAEATTIEVGAVETERPQRRRAATT